MDKSIKVVPERIGLMANGQHVTLFSAGVVEVVDSGKYTWEVTDHAGTTTRGLGMQPMDTIEAATEFATRFADIRGYTVL